MRLSGGGAASISSASRATMAPWLSISVSASPRGVDQLLVLAAQSSLRGPEDQEQHRREEQPRREGHQHDVAPGRLDGRDERRRVPPGPRPPTAAGRVDDRRNSSTTSTAATEPVAHPTGIPASTTAATGRSSPLPLRFGLRGRSDRRALARRNDAPVAIAELDPENRVLRGQPAQEIADSLLPRRSDHRRRGRCRGGGRSRTARPARRRARRPRSRSRSSGAPMGTATSAGGDADEHQHEAENDGEQHRPPADGAA